MMLMAAAALASCEKTNLNEQKAQKESYVYTISAMAPDMVDANAPAQAPTRTDYTDAGVFSWSAGDAISVLFHNNNVNKFFTLTTTESGASVKFSAQGMVISRIRSAAKMNAPLSTPKNKGVLPSISLLICCASALIRALISASVIDVLNVLSLILTMLIR